MRNKFITFISILAIASFFSTGKAEGTIVQINTSQGKILVELFDDTPLHRDNFIKLAEEHKYDNIFFHRVINMFMIQAGNTAAKATKEKKVKKSKKNKVPATEAAEEEKPLEDGDLGYTVPAEILFPKYFHRRGMLCAARIGDSENPQRASSCSQFYIVTGKYYTESELNKLEQSNGIKYTPEQRSVYMTDGGAPHLDSKYTVFGRVIKGLKVAEAIQEVPTSRTDRPLTQVVIKSVRVVKR